LPFELYLNLRKIYFGVNDIKREYPKALRLDNLARTESDECYHLKSLLSVIADSSNVEVYLLDRTHMSYLPDQILKRVF
jgi:hypothetical protein